MIVNAFVVKTTLEDKSIRWRTHTGLLLTYPAFTCLMSEDMADTFLKRPIVDSRYYKEKICLSIPKRDLIIMLSGADQLGENNRNMNDFVKNKTNMPVAPEHPISPAEFYNMPPEVARLNVGSTTPEDLAGLPEVKDGD